jgi:hypothetical protein
MHEQTDMTPQQTAFYLEVFNKAKKWFEGSLRYEGPLVYYQAVW